IVAGETTLTCAALEARANQVAHALRAAGIGTDDRVGLCVDRSAELIVGVLGILKAGAAYVPLDPSYPAERLTYVQRNSGARIVLTVRRCVMAVVSADVPTWALDDAEWWAAQPTTAPDVAIDGAQLAYVIYTSGSTGRPKGVMVTHGGLANYVAWAREAYA